MARPRRIIGTALGALALGAAVITVPAAPAHASGGCSGYLIRINLNPGAEAPSNRYGHRHTTGSHYIRSTVNVGNGRVVTWWADNAGGRDGDTADTFYTTTFCS